MNNIELCRDELTKRFPHQTIIVDASAGCYRHKIGDTTQTKYGICLIPGFSYECNQRFTGTSLRECMDKLNKLVPCMDNICDKEDAELINAVVKSSSINNV
jgi:hypothetical protein